MFLSLRAENVGATATAASAIAKYKAISTGLTDTIGPTSGRAMGIRNSTIHRNSA